MKQALFVLFALIVIAGRAMGADAGGAAAGTEGDKHTYVACFCPPAKATEALGNITKELGGDPSDLIFHLQLAAGRFADGDDLEGFKTNLGTVAEMQGPFSASFGDPVQQGSHIVVPVTETAKEATTTRLAGFLNSAMTAGGASVTPAAFEGAISIGGKLTLAIVVAYGSTLPEEGLSPEVVEALTALGPVTFTHLRCYRVDEKGNPTGDALENLELGKDSLDDI